MNGRLTESVGLLVDARNLEDLDLFGSVPSEIGLLTALTYLDLDGNFLTGTLPTEVGKCTNIVVFEGYNNWFTGSIPTEVGSLAKMTYFDVKENSLTGPIPTEFGLLRSLTGTCARPPSTTITHPWGFFHVWAWASSLGSRLYACGLRKFC